MITTSLNRCHCLDRQHWHGQLIAAEIELVVCFDIGMVYLHSILPLWVQTLEGQEECTLSTKALEVIKVMAASADVWKRAAVLPCAYSPLFENA